MENGSKKINDFLGTECIGSQALLASGGVSRDNGWVLSRHSFNFLYLVSGAA